MFFWTALDQDPGFTFEVELKANVAEGQSSCLCLQFTDAADIIVIQINVLKLLLFLHVGPVGHSRCFNQLEHT